MSYASNALDIFAAAERLAQRGWFIGRLVDPPSIYLMLNLTHESEVEAYLADLAWAVEAVATAEEIATSREFTY